MKKIILSLLIFLTILNSDENKLLFYGNCISCHGEIRKPSAPNMIEIKGYYLLKYPTKKEFVKNLSNWVYKPNKKTALLKDAIKKYNLMPLLAIDIDTLRKIATYIYENDDFGITIKCNLKMYHETSY